MRPEEPAQDDALPLGPTALVRFVGELVMLVAFGYVGWELGAHPLVSLALAVLLPSAAAGVWVLLVAPKAARRLEDPARLGVELILVGLAAAGLVVVDAWQAAIVLLVLYAIGTSHGRAGG